MEQVGVGVIGTGYIATGAHAPAITAVPGARLVAALSRTESTAREFLGTFDASGARAYDDLSAFLTDPDLDLVIVTSPDALHAPQAEACLRAGKHVLVEKPMALGLGEARTLVDLAAHGKLVLAVGYHLRCHAGHEALRERVLGGEIGTVRHLRLAWSYPFEDTNWRARSDLATWWALSATGTHCLDLARWLADDADDWARFSALIGNSRWRAPRDETAVIAAELASGPTVEVLSSVQFPEYTRVEIFGDHGSSICAGTFGPDGGGEIVLNGRPLDYTPVNPFVVQLSRLVQTIAGQAEPAADGAAGLLGVRDLLQAAA
ncbi:Gfo/Idh/MocA family protein [Asanoa siamensis]|uniref:Dehydrogenase n=1 Tax=Asanoa siamensis TaxID=926357 RepID=A0ABQ4CRT4_9ACTN|nr:Gfo/Idh/MocA family oxidoreductase [Asanoa siamensis]GIF74008.1 hypothetical protein Asi02nite_35260 [Asanoa siamensis]